MPDSDDILDAAAEAATGPKSVTVDGQTVVARDIKDIKEAADLEAGRTAATKPHFGLRFSRQVPPGCG